MRKPFSPTIHVFLLGTALVACRQPSFRVELDAIGRDACPAVSQGSQLPEVVVVTGAPQALRIAVYEGTNSGAREPWRSSTGKRVSIAFKAFDPSGETVRSAPLFSAVLGSDGTATAEHTFTLGAEPGRIEQEFVAVIDGVTWQGSEVEGLGHSLGLFTPSADGKDVLCAQLLSTSQFELRARVRGFPQATPVVFSGTAIVPAVTALTDADGFAKAVVSVDPSKVSFNVISRRGLVNFSAGVGDPSAPDQYRAAGGSFAISR